MVLLPIMSEDVLKEGFLCSTQGFPHYICFYESNLVAVSRDIFYLKACGASSSGTWQKRYCWFDLMTTRGNIERVTFFVDGHHKSHTHRKKRLKIVSSFHGVFVILCGGLELFAAESRDWSILITGLTDNADSGGDVRRFRALALLSAFIFARGAFFSMECPFIRRHREQDVYLAPNIACLASRKQLPLNRITSENTLFLMGTVAA
uniref:G_PROTEIN_RECEP_F1_2 domain-containing protein n=1 Tax=Steinernema glaseri TaxID=37863 RepID=A0A1I7YN08_9BILA